MYGMVMSRAAVPPFRQHSAESSGCLGADSASLFALFLCGLLQPRLSGNYGRGALDERPENVRA